MGSFISPDEFLKDEIGNLPNLILMIIKVPIYIEIPSFSGTELPKYVEMLNDIFSFSLRRKFDNNQIVIKHPEMAKDLGDWKIISRKQALDSLRTKK